VGSCRIGFVGDMCFGKGVSDTIQKEGVLAPLRRLAPQLSVFDMLNGNFECCLWDEAIPPTNPRALHAPTHVAPQLKEAGFSSLHLANNHVLDCGHSGLDVTLDALERAGLAPYGAGRTKKLSEAVSVLGCGGLRFAFIGAGDTSRYYATLAGGGIAGLHTRSLARRVAAARREADVVIVTLHADVEFCRYPAPWRVRLSRRLIDCGALMVIQHHPHVIQGIERYKQGLIAYSLGNFIFQIRGNDYQEAREGTDVGLILDVTIDIAVPRIASWTAHPVRIADDHFPALLDAEASPRIAKELTERSQFLSNDSSLFRARRKQCFSEAKAMGLECYYLAAKGRPWAALRRLRQRLSTPEDLRVFLGLGTAGRF